MSLEFRQRRIRLRRRVKGCPYFLVRMANKKVVLAKIKKLLGLSDLAEIIIGIEVTLKITATNIRRQPITTRSLDKLLICPPFFYKALLVLSSFISLANMTASILV